MEQLAAMTIAITAWMHRQAIAPDIFDIGLRMQSREEVEERQRGIAVEGFE